MVNLATLTDTSTPDPDDQTASEPGEVITDLRRERIVNIYRRLFRDAVGRVVKRKSADSQFVYRAFQPILSSMAEGILTLHVSGVVNLSDSDESAVGEHANRLSNESETWTVENASETATRITDEAYTALTSALIG